MFQVMVLFWDFSPCHVHFLFRRRKYRLRLQGDHTGSDGRTVRNVKYDQCLKTAAEITKT